VRLGGTIRSILTVAFLPFAVLGAIMLAMRLYGWIRFDPAYFTETQVERYGTSSAVARSLEKALQTNDEQTLAELQGLRWPARLKGSPGMAFVMLWERTDRYATYLYFDWQTYQRHLHPFEQVGGRWVVSPPDLYYWVRSGGWRCVFLRVAIGWWVLGAAGIGAVWLCRRSPRLRGWVLGS